MTLTPFETLIIICMVTLGTMLTRFLPFYCLKVPNQRTLTLVISARCYLILLSVCWSSIALRTLALQILPMGFQRP